MASKKPPGRQKMHLKKNLSVLFDGGLPQNLRSSLVCEFLKYVLFQRNQIPLPFEHIKRDLKQISQTEKSSSLQQQHQKKPTRGKSQLQKIERRKAEEAVGCIERAVELIHSAFETCPDVRQILVILGGTTVTPKERYLLTLPDYYPDLPALSSKTVIRTLFRQLITSDFVGGSKPLSATKTMVLVNAPRDSVLDSFLAKPRYKPPDRGQLYEMDWECLNNHHPDMDLSMTDDDIEISGIHPLNFSLLDGSFSDFDPHNSVTESEASSVDYDKANDCSTTITNSDPSLSVTSNANLDTPLCTGGSRGLRTKSYFPGTVNVPPQVADDEGIHSLSDEDYIWFQAPVHIKGYKDRTSKVLDSVF